MLMILIYVLTAAALIVPIAVVIAACVRQKKGRSFLPLYAAGWALPVIACVAEYLYNDACITGPVILLWPVGALTMLIGGIVLLVRRKKN